MVSNQESANRRRYHNEKDAAAFLGLSGRTLQQMRLAGGGPAFVRMGARKIAYEEADLVAWADARKCRSTSGQCAA